MANIYLVNALYNKDKLGRPPACPAQSTAKIEQPPTHNHKSADAMHPSRQQIINVLGPLKQEPDPVVYKVSGANTQPMGHKMPSATAAYAKGVAARSSAASESTGAENMREGHDTVDPIRAPRPRSILTTTPSTTSQYLQPLQVNRIMAERDPRRRANNVDLEEATSCWASMDIAQTQKSMLKQEHMTSEPFSPQPDSKMLASPPDTASPYQRADSLPPSSMAEGDHHRHRSVTTTTLSRPDEQSKALRHSDYDAPHDSEIRIRELEDENIALRRGGFRKDREIRKLKAELLRKGGHVDLFELGRKRPRYDEGPLPVVVRSGIDGFLGSGTNDRC